MAEQNTNDQEFFEKATSWFEENKNVVNIGLTVLAVVIAGYFYYANFYMPGKVAEVEETFHKTERLFAIDSFSVALNGKPASGINEAIPGFLKIADNYGMTKQGKLSKYYAGICYLQLGQFNEAIEQLKAYGGDDVIVMGMAYGAIGDANMELGNTDDAISFYKKAAAHKPDEFTSPMFLMKAAQALEIKGDDAGALALYKQIKRDYPRSTQGQQIETYIARVNG